MDFDRRPHSRWYAPQQDVPPKSLDRRRPQQTRSEHSLALQEALNGFDREPLKHPHQGVSLHRRASDR